MNPDAPEPDEKPVLHPVWDGKGAPVIEPYQLALMDDERLEDMIEAFDDSIEDVIPHLRSPQDYAMLTLSFIGVLEAANALAVREQA